MAFNQVKNLVVFWLTLGRLSYFLNGCFLDGCFLDGCFLLVSFWMAASWITAFDFQSLQNSLGQTGCLVNLYFLFTGCLSIQFFLFTPNTVSQATYGYLPLTVQHLYDLGNVMIARYFPPNRYLGKWRISFGVRGILTIYLIYLSWVVSIDVPKVSFKARVPHPWNLPLTGFKTAFLKDQCVGSCVSGRLGHGIL